jgi:hypothetical protein
MLGEQLGRVRVRNNELEVYSLDSKVWYTLKTKEEIEWLIEVQERTLRGIYSIKWYKRYLYFATQIWVTSRNLKILLNPLH